MPNCPVCNQALTEESSVGGHTYYKCTNTACRIIRLCLRTGVSLKYDATFGYSQVWEYPKGQPMYAK
jgi:hypothetical protein